MTGRVLTCALLVALAAAPAASAARNATAKEAAAIKRAFFKTHPQDATTIDAIKVSTKDKRFAAIRYSVAMPSGSIEAGAPSYAKKGKGGKARLISPAKLPKKVAKDLGRKGGSEIRITGAYEATLTGTARCRSDEDSFTMGLYDRARDIYVDIDSFEFRGPGFYSLRQVWSIAGVAIGNNATSHTYETTWGEPDVEKGRAFVDLGGGVISATMGPQPPPEEDDPSTFVQVEGHWTCG